MFIISLATFIAHCTQGQYSTADINTRSFACCGESETCISHDCNSAPLGQILGCRLPLLLRRSGDWLQPRPRLCQIQRGVCSPACWTRGQRHKQGSVKKSEYISQSLILVFLHLRRGPCFMASVHQDKALHSFQSHSLTSGMTSKAPKQRGKENQAHFSSQVSFRMSVQLELDQQTVDLYGVQETHG